MTRFHNFLVFYMILTSTYCDSEEEFIKNSPLLNALNNNNQIIHNPIHDYYFSVKVNIIGLGLERTHNLKE